MEQLISAIARYHPSFRSEIEGCTSEELERLQSLVGRPLPVPHVDFLLAMGHRMADLSFQDGDFRIETLIQLYAQGKVPRDSAPVIGISRYGIDGNPAQLDERPIELDQDEESGEFVLTAYPPSERPYEFPESLRIFDLVEPTLYEALFAKAYLRYRWSQFTCSRTLFIKAHSPKEVEQGASLLTRFGFEQHSESTVVRYFDRHDATAILSPNPGEHVRISLAAGDEKCLRQLADSLGQLGASQRG
ncbi:hypothetical protein [Myxococcus xanthus]|uniref:Knr4/Smi1-like domain-containing protein n=1 Tax=Myxococcus xanthus TaxID=34 RepID=A0A7Y4IR12_MYXXA|nr:hypothetical protein [Myxococcus xanthus]NOJ83866.1 hypothetical protein [Myxococcus xanthus]NOJ91194.1 hypothetical protein [Myxococcus xanthus]